MSTLMPLPERSLLLPVAVLMTPPSRLPAWLRDCLTTVQSQTLEADHAAETKTGVRRELQLHERRACLELLVDSWQDALCPNTVFGDLSGVFHNGIFLNGVFTPQGAAT